MNSTRWLSERTVSAIPRSALRPQAIRHPIRRNFAILQPAKRIITPSSRNRCLGQTNASRSAPNVPYRQTVRKFWANSSKSSSNPTPHLGSPAPAPSLSQRLRKLSREYGWSAFGVYFALSALDFPFCFLAVRLLGTDRIGRWEHAVIGAFWDVVRIPFPNYVSERQAVKTDNAEVVTEEIAAVAREGGSGWSSGLAQAEVDNTGSNASIWTQLALAYAIHKSFIFIRVPLAAAVTPKVVKTLRGWGWDIGKRRPKPTAS